MINIWQGDVPDKIPMLPKIISQSVINQLTNNIDYKDKLILGLYKETVTPASFDLEHNIAFITNNILSIEYYCAIINYNIDRLVEYETMILDPCNKLMNYKFIQAKYIKCSLLVRETIEEIIIDLKIRQQNPQKTYQAWLLVITDIISIIKQTNMTDDDIKLIFIEGPKYGVTLILLEFSQSILTNYEYLAKLTKQLLSQIFIGMSINEQEYLRLPFQKDDPLLKPYEGYIIKDQTFAFVQLINIDKEKKIGK